MSDRLTLILLLPLLLALVECNRSTEAIIRRNLMPFGVSYDKVTPGQAEGYSLLIVEPDNYSKLEVEQLKSQGIKVIAYVALGEVDRNRWYFPLLEERGFLGVNKNWDSPYLNLADSTTRAIMLEKVIPEIMVKDFDGLFLDTIDDVAPYTERSDLQPYMLELIRRIRRQYPQSMVVQNAGLFLLERSSRFVDAVLIEDVATMYNFQNKTYNLQHRQEYREKVKRIRELSDMTGKPFLIVDFARTEALRERARNRLDTLRFPYFIGTIELNDLASGYARGLKKSQ